MSDLINQYELLAPFQNKNAGFSKWTYGVKDGQIYFLKEFLNPVYPTDESISLEFRNRIIQECEQYEKKHKMFYEAVNSAATGNIVRISEFFRSENHYYIATDMVKGEEIDISEMQNIPYEDRFLLCKTIAYSMMKLHQAKVIHADVKPSNIMIKKTKNGKLVGKIIDFDSGFLEDDPPLYGDELGGDQVYLAPESCLFIEGDSVELTCKIDVFALGILFHQYLTGQLPGFDSSEADYIFEAVLDEQRLQISEELDSRLQKMIQGMLECEPEKRLSMEQVYSVFLEIDPEPKKIVEIHEKEKKRPEDWFFSVDKL